jgi:hypothetical protein
MRSVTSRTAFVFALAAIASCGGTSTMTMTRSAGGRLVEPPPRARRPAAWESAVPAQERLAGRPFAPSPITSFAEQMTDLALAAVEGRPLPTAPVATRRPLEGALAEVTWSEHTTRRPRNLEVLAFALEVELILKRGQPEPDAHGPERWGTLRTTFVVNRNGVRLVSLRPGALSPTVVSGRPPAGLEGLPELARELLAHLRRSDISPYDFTEEDRRLLSNDTVWAEIHQDRPTRARLGDIARMLADLPDAPLAYRLDDIGILTRDDEGRLYGLALELDPDQGSFALATSPLVQVRRLWPTR